MNSNTTSPTYPSWTLEIVNTISGGDLWLNLLLVRVMLFLNSFVTSIWLAWIAPNYVFPLFRLATNIQKDNDNNNIASTKNNNSTNNRNDVRKNQ